MPSAGVTREGNFANRSFQGLRLLVALCASVTAFQCAATRPEREASAAASPALQAIVADYVGLYARPTLDRWKTLFHPSLVVAYPTEDGGVKVRGLEEFFKAQKDYFE